MSAAEAQETRIIFPLQHAAYERLLDVATTSFHTCGKPFWNLVTRVFTRWPDFVRKPVFKGYQPLRFS